MGLTERIWLPRIADFCLTVTLMINKVSVTRVLTRPTIEFFGGASSLLTCHIFLHKYHHICTSLSEETFFYVASIATVEAVSACSSSCMSRSTSDFNIKWLFLTMYITFSSVFLTFCEFAFLTLGAQYTPKQ